MVEAMIVARTVRKKVKRFTRKQRHALHVTMVREARASAKSDLRAAQASARRESRVLEVFKGCDPVRTLALLGEEY